jgi:hypothetical protein
MGPSGYLWFCTILKNYPSFDVLGLSFGIDATTAERYVVELLPVVAKTLRKRKCLPARKAEEIARLRSYWARPISS